MPTRKSEQTNSPSVSSARHRTLAMAVAFLFTGMASLVLVESTRSYQALVEKAEFDTQNMATAVEQYTAGVFKRVSIGLDQVTQVLAHQPPGRRITPMQLHELALHIKKEIPEIEVLGITDANGDYLATSAYPPGPDGKLPRPISVADRNYFKRHRAEPETTFIISEPVITKTTKTLGLVLSRKLPARDGGFDGVVLCSVTLDVFSRFFSQISTGEGGLISLWDPNRILLARHPVATDLIGKYIEPPTELATLLAERRTSGTYTTRSKLDDVSRVFTFRKLDGLPLQVIVGKSRSVVIGPWRRTLAITIFLGLLVLSFSILAILRYRQQLDRFEAQRALSLQSAKMSSLGEMASGMAHEINNPLAIILGRTHQIIKSIDSGEPDLDFIRTTAQKINDTADRIAKIIRGLRTMSRNAEKDPMSPVSLRSIVESVLDLAAERFKSNGITLEVGGLPEVDVNCREAQIAQVLLNLLNNAFDAVQPLPGKWVRLEARTEGPRLDILVTDSGEGIPSEIADKITQPFFTTKEADKGTGLGLSISKAIIEEHGGRLYVDRDCPNTRFVIQLPIATT